MPTVVLGGVLDKELRDFEVTQRRRRRTGPSATTDLSVLLLEGYGKAAFDPVLFAWFRAHDGRLASLFGAAGTLYVYDAEPPPARRVLPRAGDRVIAHRRPYAGQPGVLLEQLAATLPKEKFEPTPVDGEDKGLFDRVKDIFG